MNRRLVKSAVDSTKTALGIYPKYISGMLRQWINIFLTTNHCTFKELLCLSEQVEVQGINCIPNNLDDWNRGKHCYSYGSNLNFF